MTLKQILPGLALALALALAAGGTAGAQSVASTGQSFVTVELLAGPPAENGTRMAGLAFDLAEGWKTYWRSPGAAGVPPEFDWSGSTNLAHAEVLWPTPEVFESFGIQTVGYGGRVVLPVRLVAERPGEAIAAELELRFGVCREICVLEEATLSGRFAPDDSAGALDVAEALNSLPPSGEHAGLRSATCRIEGAGETRRFEARLAFDEPIRMPVVVVEAPKGAWFHHTRTEAAGRALTVRAKLGLADPGAWVAREAIRFTVLGEGFAAEIEGCAAPGG